MRSLLIPSLLLLLTQGAVAFLPTTHLPTRPSTTTSLPMAVDMVTYLRTEFVAAALFTNQTPRSADVALQLGCEDGRSVIFLPRTIRDIITSAPTPDGKLSVAAKRRLQQQQERREGGATVRFKDQRADDLVEVKDNTVDVVITLQSAAKLLENGMDWKKSIREAARVLKPGGRFLFVEQTELEGESYLDYVQSLYTVKGNIVSVAANEGDEDGSGEEMMPLFDVGHDDIDLVLKPHIAGVAIKNELAGMTKTQIAQKAASEERERLADLSLEAFERGIKKRKRKRKNATEEATSKSG